MMKLYGYMKPFTRYSFSIPVYRENGKYYHHNLNDNFVITSFSILENTEYIIPLKSNKKYKVKDNGMIVFVALEDDVIFGEPRKSIPEICLRLKKLDSPRIYISKEVFNLAKRLNIDISNDETIFMIKNLLNVNSPNKQILLELIDIINEQNRIFIKNRKRKASFKDLKKQNLHKFADINKINNLKLEIIKRFKIENYDKGLIETKNLLKYQLEVSPFKYIIKSFTDISHEFIEQGNLSAAKLFIYLAKLFPVNDPVVNCQEAEILKAEGKLSEAKKLYKQIQQEYPSNRVAKTGYAEILKAEGKLSEAKKLYEQIQQEYPNDIVAKNAYAEILKAEGKLSEAKKLYEQIQQEYPSNRVAKTGYAEILKAEGKLSEAKKLYEQIQQEYPNDIVAKTGYAEILKAEGKLSEAKKLYEQIQQEYPSNRVAKTGYAEILKAEGKLSEAKKLYEQIQQEYPNDIFAKTGYAEILKAEGKLSEAKKLYEQIQQEYPNDIFAKTGYAEILKAEGKLSEAKKLYEQIQQEYPSNRVAKTGYAEILKAEGKLSEAKKLYEQIQQEYPNDIFVRHGLVTCKILLGDDVKDYSEYLNFQYPETESDYYFYHSRIMLALFHGETEVGKKLILEVINKVPFYNSKIIFKTTLKLIRVIDNEFIALANELKTNEISKNVVDNILNTHILAEVGKIEDAKFFLNDIKKYPKESIAYENASLLSEIYNLNGLPKKYKKVEDLKELLVQSEINAILIY